MQRVGEEIPTFEVPIHEATAAGGVIPDGLIYAIAKRAFDIAFAVTLLIALAPLMLLIAILVRRSSPGPVIFKQERVGRHGKTFSCLKFRTMVENADAIIWANPELAEQFKSSWKLTNDARVTPVGRWLRKLSLDELPQLFNVLCGDMSVVGPRPVRPKELQEQFGVWADTVTSVRPGLTSLWSISGRSLLTYEERIRLEVKYVRTRSFFRDMWVIIMTIPAVITGKGAV